MCRSLSVCYIASVATAVLDECQCYSRGRGGKNIILLAASSLQRPNQRPKTGQGFEEGGE